MKADPEFQNGPFPIKKKKKPWSQRGEIIIGAIGL